MIESFIALFPAGLMQSLILALVATGVMIPFRCLRFADISAEGAYPLGGALCASLLAAGFPAIFATLGAIVASGLMGIGTAFIHLRFKVNTLLAGILLSTMVYSVNLRLMGQPNVALFEIPTLFSTLAHHYGLMLAALCGLCLLILFSFYRFLGTEKGLCFRVVGLNSFFAQKQGINLTAYIFLGLFLGNALSGLAGALFVQIQQYADIGMGSGIVLHGLAALMIGEALLGTQSLARQILAPLVGALIYQQIQGLALSLGLAPSDLKLITGVIVLLSLSYQYFLPTKGVYSAERQ